MRYIKLDVRMFLLYFPGIKRTFIPKIKVLHVSNFMIINVENDPSLQEYSIVL